MGEKPSYSIIFAVHDQAEAIRKHLPSWLMQQTDADYEVIVVDESSTDDTVDVLKQLKSQYPRLYTTFLPRYHFQKNRQRLALTIGVKASHHPWIVFADLSIPPPSESWLQELPAFTKDSTDLLFSYDRTSHVRIQSFTLKPAVYHSVARSLITKAECRLIHGHDGWFLRYLRGKYDRIIVRAEYAHDTLRYFNLDATWLQRMSCRLRIASYNIFH